MTHDSLSNDSRDERRVLADRRSPAQPGRRIVEGGPPLPDRAASDRAASDRTASDESFLEKPADTDESSPADYQIAYYRFDGAGSSVKPPKGLELDSEREAEPESGEESSVQDSAAEENPQRAARRPDPLTQSLMLLATMGLMLLAARFAVPSIVEEVRYAWHRGELRAEYETGTEGLRNVSLDALSDAYQMVTAAVGPSVVHIDVQRRTPISPEITSLLSSRSSPASDQGSGVVVDADGYLLTNRHVIADGEDITVTLSDGRRVPALVVGTDRLTDLAVLKVDADRLIPITWGDSDRCRVGSPVWAVGSPFGLDRTVTFGILSGKHRLVRASTQYQDFMQSDVAVNPGNSGGPLVDARGTLVGINTAIYGDTYQGVSFSIPSNVVRQVYDRLRTTGYVERGFLGVMLEEVPEERFAGENQRVRGALVARVPRVSTPGAQSPAAAAGIIDDDVIVKIDEVDVRDKAHLMQLIGVRDAGSKVMLDIRRGDEVMRVPVILGMRPESLDQ